MMNVYTLQDSIRWDEIVRSFSRYDVYYLSGYAKACQVHGEGEPLLFYYEGDRLRGIHVVMKRDIAQAKSLCGRVAPGNWFDFATPYGYGGWLLEGEGEKKQLFCMYESWCQEHHIVSEFARFHPVLDNAKDVQGGYRPVCIRNTLGTNLADFDDPVQSEFSKSCRKSIRQALRKGITYRVTQSPENINDFLQIYYSTMDRDGAIEFYYFGKDYFDTVLTALKSDILYVEAIFEEKTIAAGLYFVSNGIIHIHLSGTLSEYLYLSPAYILRYGAALWGKEHGCRLIHHGGGTSNAEDNSLFMFKKQFAKNTLLEFYVGKQVWNEEQYAALCIMAGADAEDSFFPAYRK